MDLITHALAGTMIGRAGAEKRVPQSATALLVISALAPDIDNLLVLKGPAAYMDYHRSLTHSLLGGLALAALIAAVFVLRCPRQSRSTRLYRNAWLLSSAGIYAHIFLDLITAYGTQILFPFSNHRYSLNLTVIIDPLFTLLFTIPFWPILGRHRQRRARLSLHAVGSYLLLCAGMNAWAHHAARVQFANAGITAGSVEAIPRPPSPLSWFIVSETPNAFQQIQVAPWGAGPIVIYPRTVDPNLLTAAGKTSDVATFMRFAAYPFVTLERTTDGRVLTYQDLRFFGLQGNSMRPFTLRVTLDDNGHVIATRFTPHRDDQND